MDKTLNPSSNWKALQKVNQVTVRQASKLKTAFNQKLGAESANTSSRAPKRRKLNKGTEGGQIIHIQERVTQTKELGSSETSPTHAGPSRELAEVESVQLMVCLLQH